MLLRSCTLLLAQHNDNNNDINKNDNNDNHNNNNNNDNNNNHNNDNNDNQNGHTTTVHGDIGTTINNKKQQKLWKNSKNN